MYTVKRLPDTKLAIWAQILSQFVPESVAMIRRHFDIVCQVPKSVKIVFHHSTVPWVRRPKASERWILKR